MSAQLVNYQPKIFQAKEIRELKSRAASKESGHKFIKLPQRPWRLLSRTGMPLAGDTRYASKESVKQWKKKGLQRVFLHAHRLSFETLSGEEMEFSAPLPEHLKAVLDRLEECADNRDALHKS